MKKPTLFEFGCLLREYTTFRKESYKRTYDRVFSEENISAHEKEPKLAHWSELFFKTIKSISKDEKCYQIKENVPSRECYGIIVGCYKKPSEDQKEGSWSCIVTKNGKRLRMLSGVREDKYINLLQTAVFYALKTIPKKSFFTVYSEDEELTKILTEALQSKLSDIMLRAITSDMNARYMDVRDANEYGLNALCETAKDAAAETYKTKKPIYESYIS